MKNLSEIIDALEKLTGPDRSVDAMIGCAVKHKTLRPACEGDHGITGKEVPGYIWCETGFLVADRYTYDEHIALGLVPAGHELTLHTHIDDKPCPYVSVRLIGGKGRGAGRVGRAPTLALSICIAALSAQLKIEDNAARAARQAEALPA